jgi:UDP-N-acetylglucosamine:LPS N-acetylglucosamine transferase
MKRKGESPRTVLAISSGGGHWKQLMLLKPAWEGMPVVYATVRAENRKDVGDAPFYVVPDGNVSTRWALIRMSLQILELVMRVRPHTVVSTGAAPGFFALFFGKLFGARTIWVDSIANADELSLSGRKVRRFADAWLTQWQHLSGPHGPEYHGRVV